MELRKDLVAHIQQIIATAREWAIRSVDTKRVLMYWQIGKVIFEEEQQGNERAGYGDSFDKVTITNPRTAIWHRLLIKAVKFVSSVLPHFSNCVRTAFTIQLDPHYRTQLIAEVKKEIEKLDQLKNE